ncbi:Oxoglutarate/iron-dependent dioxygenase [Parasponia andersonii]|uniref:Oxoglutarate/iron-dependent dioxygenase n=1 Tax=Parasponia andersonii TaxID=3476 RepID=A0A2P5C4E9_PARAD|nr:Oxoglutarate/iron-dependent dioxygenase [Parasponia andersonii]
MAAKAPQNSQSSNEASFTNNIPVPKTKMFVKSLAESPDLISIPSSYASMTGTPNTENQELSEEPEVKFPTIDFSLLTSGNPDQRSKVVDELAKACEEWGFFMVINHEVPERLMEAVIDGCREFFDLSDEDKLEFEGKHLLDPIRCGTSFNTTQEKVFYWRDYVKTFVHPQFFFPHTPQGFSEIAREYSKRTREVFLGIVEGISESLGLKAHGIYKTLNLESGIQIFMSNLYPPCPQPELAQGLPPHSDHGFLTFLTQNGVDGLQIQHNGKWINVSPIPNSFLVNTGDQLEILSNGKYKSLIHRVVLHRNKSRISLSIANGPSLDTVVTPAPELTVCQRPAYAGIKYKDFLELQQSNNLYGKSVLDRVRI